MATSTIQNIIGVLNSQNTNLLAIQKFMLLNQVQRAAKLGDVDAQRFVQLCQLNIHEAAKH